MKLTKIVKDIVLEGNLSDHDGYNTEAALRKEKEIKNKNVKPEDAITDLDLNTLNRNQTIKEYGSWIAEVVFCKNYTFIVIYSYRFFPRIFLFTKRILNCRLNFNSFKVVVLKN